MTEFSQQTAVGLLRALQRQFASLEALATGKALGLPDTSFAHYRKLGEAAGLHTAWRMVADLADQVAENRLPQEHVISAHTFTEPKDGELISTLGGPRGLSAAESLRNLQADLSKLVERAQAKRSRAPESEQPKHQAAAQAYQQAWRRVAEIAQRFEDRERVRP